MLDRINQLERFLTLDPDNAALKRELALAYHRQGRQDRAIDLLQELRGQDTDAALLNDIAAVHLAQGKWREAVEELKEAVARAHDAAALRFNLGFALLASGDYQEAALQLDKSVQLGENTPRVHYLLALARGESGAQAAAQLALDGLFALDPGHHDGLLLAAHLCVEQGQLDRARDIAAQATELHGASSEAWWLAGEIAMLRGDPIEGESAICKALVTNRQEPFLHVALGQALLAQLEAKRAEAAFEDALNLDADDTAALLGRAWSRLLQQNITGAQRDFERAIENDSNFADAHAGLGLALVALGQRNEAERAICHALELDEENVTALVAKSRLAEMSGDLTAAHRLAQQLLESHSSRPLAERNMDLMKRFANGPFGQRLRATIAQAPTSTSATVPRK